MARRAGNGGSRPATIVGAGQGGMHLAFGLHALGWDVTLVSDRPAEQRLASQAMASHGLRARSMRFEEDAGFDCCDGMIPHLQTGIGFTLSPNGQDIELEFRSWCIERMRAVGSRYKMAPLLESFERHCGRVVYKGATLDDVEAYAEQGPVFMASERPSWGGCLSSTRHGRLSTSRSDASCS